MLPADGLLAVGYTWRLGSLTVSPRAAWRIQLGGVEKNFLFDDATYQSLGGELPLVLELSSVSLELEPRVFRVFDAGTLAVSGYGSFEGGWSLGGRVGAGLRLGRSLSLHAYYAYGQVSAGFAGFGERGLGPITARDDVHSGAVSLQYDAR
jgi:hypothetical protein